HRCTRSRTRSCPTAPPRGAGKHSGDLRPTRLSRWAAASTLDPGCTAEIVTYLFNCLISSPENKCVLTHTLEGCRNQQNHQYGAEQKPEHGSNALGATECNPGASEGEKTTENEAGKRQR